MDETGKKFFAYKCKLSLALAAINEVTGADPGFFSGRGAPLRNGVTDW